MKKIISIILAILMLGGCFCTAAAAGETPRFTYKMKLTDGSGSAVRDPAALSAGDKLNVEIIVTRTDITTDSYDAYGVEFKVTSNGLSYNGDGVSFREGSPVGAVEYFSGLVTGVTYLDLAQQGETVSNPLKVGSWSYTVDDPAEVSLAVTTAIVYVTDAGEGEAPVEKVVLTLNPAGGSIRGGDVSGEYDEGDVVTLPSAVRSGYDFNGWSDGTDKYPAGGEYTVTDTVTLTAQWTKQSGGLPGDMGGGTERPPKEEEPEAPAEGDTYELGYNVEMLITDRHVNYIDGYEDGTIRPGNSITRAEVSAIFYRLLREEYAAKYKSNRSVFNDVDPDAWYGTAVCTLANAGIIDGYPDGGFHPQANITRAELVTIIDRFSDAVGKEDVFSDIYGHWAYDSIATAAMFGWVNGYPDGTFKPNASITRAEVFAVVNRLLGRYVESAGDLLSGMMTFKDNLDTGKWYYCDVQEAANYHDFSRKNEGKYEKWTELLTNIDY